MDEQRIKDYLALIERLLTCPSGEEAAILQESSELVDMGLVQVMKVRAEELTKEGQENPAAFLQNVAGQLERMLEGQTDSGGTVPQEVLEFLMAVLKAKIEGGREEVFRVLRSRLDLLDQRFLATMVAWALSSIESAEREQAEGIAGLIGNICIYLSDFPLGDRAMNLEIAIAGYEKVVLKVFSRETHGEVWAQTQNNLATALRERIRGDRAEN
ncbi:MAG: hypothetical protein AAF889_11310, partial [Cyanobacteria bacterium P01_D01_bin.73]